MLFLGTRPTDALALAAAAPTCVISCEDGPEVSAVERRLHCEVLAVESRAGSRRVWTNASMAEAAASLLAHEGTGAAVAIPYAISDRLLRVLHARGGRVLAPPAPLKAALDDKPAVRRALGRLGIPVPRSATVRAGHLRFDAARAALGLPFVVQRRTGSAGIGTWIVHEPTELETIDVPMSELLLVSRYARGLTVNVHAVVLAEQVRVGPASVQATGVDGAATHAAGYCGNDFGLATTALDPQAAELVVRHTGVVGQWLRKRGYRGVFGIDYVVGERPLALEINPRLQGSTWLLAELERRDGRVGIGEAHTAAWSTRAEPVASAYSAHGLRGSFLVVHHCGAAPMRAQALLRAGVYALEGPADQLVWRREGLGPGDCAGPAELVVGGLPRAGAAVEPGAVLARISTPAGLLADSSSLSPFGARALGAVLARLHERAPLTPASAGAPCAAS